jgi:hypothetical protein
MSSGFRKSKDYKNMVQEDNGRNDEDVPGPSAETFPPHLLITAVAARDP